MANALGFSYGQVLKDAESIKSARLAREGQKISNERNQVALDQERKNMGDSANALSLRTRAVGGDASAVPELIALDPAEGKEFLSAFTAMGEQEREEQRRGVESMGRIAAAVLSSENPQQLYAQMRSEVPQEIQAMLPPEYNEDWVNLQLSRAMEFDSLMASVVGARSEDQKQGNKIELEKIKASMKTSAEGGGREMKSADSNSIYRQAAAYFDGLIGPDGAVSLTDPKDAAKLQQLASKSSEIWANSNVTHAQAVEQAADMLNYGLESKPTGGGNADPLGLFSDG